MNIILLLFPNIIWILYYYYYFPILLEYYIIIISQYYLKILLLLLFPNIIWILYYYYFPILFEYYIIISQYYSNIILLFPNIISILYYYFPILFQYYIIISQYYLNIILLLLFPNIIWILLFHNIIEMRCYRVTGFHARRSPRARPPALASRSVPPWSPLSKIAGIDCDKIYNGDLVTTDLFTAAMVDHLANALFLQSFGRKAVGREVTANYTACALRNTLLEHESWRYRSSGSRKILTFRYLKLF